MDVLSRVLEGLAAGRGLWFVGVVLVIFLIGIAPGSKSREG